MVHVDIYMRGIGEPIWNAGSEQAVVALFVVDDYGPVCVGDERMLGRRGPNGRLCGWRR
jgi:hypothetical protein